MSFEGKSLDKFCYPKRIIKHNNFCEEKSVKLELDYNQFKNQRFIINKDVFSYDIKWIMPHSSDINNVLNVKTFIVPYVYLPTLTWSILKTFPIIVELCLFSILHLYCIFLLCNLLFNPNNKISSLHQYFLSTQDNDTVSLALAQASFLLPTHSTH